MKRRSFLAMLATAPVLVVETRPGLTAKPKGAAQLPRWVVIQEEPHIWSSNGAEYRWKDGGDIPCLAV